ncbi:hypothetical protein V8G54_037491 [Vigna mungo]|uniref:Uncharacterized protein n=1 Tax=Vigna mungo TaxID=3915 RepID=A0AAQ3RGJ4_VIGMU
MLQNQSPRNESFLQTELKQRRVRNKRRTIPSKPIHPKPCHCIKFLHGTEHHFRLFPKRKQNLILRPTPFLQHVDFGIPNGFRNCTFGLKGHSEGHLQRVKPQQLHFLHKGSQVGAENKRPSF